MKSRILGFVLAGLLLGATVPTAAATTTKTVFVGTSASSNIETPGIETWDGTVLHVRGMVSDYDSVTDSPYVTGLVRVFINYDLDVATGCGELWGTDVVYPTAFPDGGFFDHWQGTWACAMPPSWTGKSTGHGFGSLEGYQIRQDISTNPVVSGIVFRPGQ